VLTLLCFGLVTTDTSLVKPILVGLFYAYMGIVAVDAGEVDFGVVFI
jgi:hypothetical protein